MCRYCREQDSWEIVPATVKNDSTELQYFMDPYTGRVIELKPGETKQTHARLSR